MGDVAFDFSGRAVVVTGGTSGIGRAVAAGFGAAGADVTITGTRDRGEYDDDFEGFAFRRVELAVATDAEGLASSIARCDVLVNVAGGLTRDPSELTPEGFAQTIESNLNGTFRVCHALHPLLGRDGGAIVNFASMVALFGSPRVPGYSAAKGGLISLTRSLAHAWAGDGIRVNAVAPGYIETRLIAGQMHDPERSAQILDRTPLGRWGTPDDVVGPVLFLASDAARFVTGAVLTVDGGYSAA